MSKNDWSDTLTVVPGFEVGHAQDREALTGVTAVLCPGGAVGGMHARGGAVGGRQLQALDPRHVVDRVQGVLLCGGSAFGLAAADGAMAALERRGEGFDVGGMRVPILPTAVIFDLKLGDGLVRPDAAMGHQAVDRASAEPVAQGCVGAGTGASVGKLLGVECATKGGLGSAGARFADGLAVGAVAVVNAFGDLRDLGTGRILAGARLGPDSRRFADTWGLVTTGSLPDSFGEEASLPGHLEVAEGTESSNGTGSQNTTLGVVVTNAALSALEVELMARLAGDAFARTLSPGATRYDGDLVLALAAGQSEDADLPVADPHRVGLLAREALEAALVRAVREAEPLGGLPASRGLVSRADPDGGM